MLRASIDDQRFNRKQIFNQETDGDFQLYMANCGLKLVDPQVALTEPEALRYVKEGMGILPWAGNDLKDEPGNPRPVKGTYPNGPNWYTSTSRGTLKGWRAYMPTGDYGEQGGYTYMMALMTGDPEVRARAIQIEKARLPFRFPSVDRDGFRVMTVSEPIGLPQQGPSGSRCVFESELGAPSLWRMKISLSLPPSSRRCWMTGSFTNSPWIRVTGSITALAPICRMNSTRQ